IDRENRNAKRGGDAGGGEQCAVSTKDQQELRLLRDRLASEALDRVAEASGRLDIIENANAACIKPMEETRHDDGEVGSPRPRNNADCMEGSGRLHGSLRFYSSTFFRVCRKYS